MLELFQNLHGDEKGFQLFNCFQCPLVILQREEGIAPPKFQKFIVKSGRTAHCNYMGYS